jgi:hypothetical protein
MMTASNHIRDSRHDPGIEILGKEGLAIFEADVGEFVPEENELRRYPRSYISHRPARP